MHWLRVEIFVKTVFLVEKAFFFEILITVLRFELEKCFHLPVRYLFKLTKSFTQILTNSESERQKENKKRTNVSEEILIRKIR